MRQDICAGILAGGQSLRMGRNKALLEYEGHSLLEQKWILCDEFSERLISVNSPERYTEENISFLNKKERNRCLVFDQLKQFGPLEGIYRLLCETKKEYVLILAVDMPFLTKEFLTAFCEQLEGEDCLVLMNDEEKPEPLCSVYGKKCIRVLEEMRSQNLHRPRMLFDHVHTKYVKLKDLGFDQQVICNMNTPEDYLKLRKENRETD